MKKALPYILGAVLLLLVALLLLVGRGNSWDERITLNTRDKIPYGTHVAFNQLKYLFPEADIVVNKKEPGYWSEEITGDTTGKQALIILTKRFNASNAELTELFDFVSMGNDVFVSAYEFSYDTDNFFHITTSFASGYNFGGSGMDSLGLRLSKPPYANSNEYVYPGKGFHSYFGSVDTSMVYLMGSTTDSVKMFIKLSAGEGNFYLHAAPLAFSNYFLLHKNNISYYNNVLSSIPADTKRIIWDEYYHHKPTEQKQKDRSPFRVLMQQPAFKAGIITALAALLLFVLLGLKRRQRIIPVIKPLGNDSLDFVKTIGRLYFQKKDNHNLAVKMSSFFAEYVHTHFHMATNDMDEEFVNRLSQKSGADTAVVSAIAGYIKYVHDINPLSDQQLIEYYTLLDKFYKTV